MDIELREVADENFKDVVNLDVRPAQSNRVAPNVWSLAQAKVNPIRLPYAIYHGDSPVGFVMFDGAAREPGRYHISRLMIDRAHQGKGYGRAAMLEVIRRIKARPDCREIVLDYTTDNTEARSLYQSLGFREIGTTEAGTILACLQVRVDADQ